MKMLDFNSIQQPTWPVKLKDKDQTIVNLSVPSVQLLDRLMASAPEMTDAAKTKDGRTVRALYELIADIMNCNDDGYTFTAEELRDTYHMTLLDVFRFTAGYMEFCKEIQDAKN